MASSSSRNSEASSKSFHGGGPGFVCDCKLPVTVRSSNSVANLNRRYMWCPRYTGFQCDFFKWLDPPNPRFFEGALPEIDIDMERQKRFGWIGDCARLEQVEGVEAKNRELELKIADLKSEKKKIKKELMICHFVICSLFILLVALKLG